MIAYGHLASLGLRLQLPPSSLQCANVIWSQCTNEWPQCSTLSECTLPTANSTNLNYLYHPIISGVYEYSGPDTYAISRKISTGHFQCMWRRQMKLVTLDMCTYNLRFQEESFILAASCMFDGDVIAHELTSWLAKLARFIPEYKPHTCLWSPLKVFVKGSLTLADTHANQLNALPSKSSCPGFLQIWGGTEDSWNPNVQLWRVWGGSKCCCLNDNLFLARLHLGCV